MSALKWRMILTAGLLAIMAAAGHAQMSANKMIIPRGSLCVTEGAVDAEPGDHLTVVAPKMRAYINGWTSQALEAHFTYLGPTREESRLGSGEIRRVRIEAARAECLQPGLRDVAVRTSIPNCCLREEKSGRDDERAVRQSRLPEHQGRPKQSHAAFATGRIARPWRGDAWDRAEGDNRQQTSMGWRCRAPSRPI